MNLLQFSSLFQALDLTTSQLEWVTNHLGHSLDIHKIHYRQTHSLIERTQVAKLLLLQDSNKIHKYTNMSLEEIPIEGEI
jgi:hypothetical protein